MDARLDELFIEAASAAGVSPAVGRGLALVAVGGYGRGELSPASDVDVVLVHDPSLPAASVATVADGLWYPLWDDGVDLDHAVRSTTDMVAAAAADVRASTGMLDARTVAGDASMVLTLRSQVLADWRRDARARLAELRAARTARIERSGWLAHSAAPDLKESGGGLRDCVVMRALTATWLIDVPFSEIEPLRQQLLDVRDALHTATGRRSDRLGMDVVPDVAELLGREPAELDLHTREIGRRIAHLTDLAWRRVDDVLGTSPRSPRRGGRPRLERLDTGLAALDGEVVLTSEARPADDPRLTLRAAVAASTRRLVLASSATRRLAAQGRPLGEPWSESARDLLVELLSSGPGLRSAWESLDLDGLVDPWLPEWEAIRLRGSSSPVHLFTVDRHSVDTTINAAGLVRTVARPDLLVVAALLHDIGKGAVGDHSVVGAPMARAIARRWGFAEADAATVGELVRWHLLLPTVATRRDIEDPATAANVAEIVGDRDMLTLLAALTESDARATGPTAWTAWRAGLVRGLVDKVHDVLADGVSTPDPEDYDGWPFVVPATLAEDEVVVRETEHHTGSLVEIDALDRIALMADLAGALAVTGLRIRSARVGGTGRVAATLWEVSSEDVDLDRLRQRIRRVLTGDLDLDARLRYVLPEDAPEPVVRVVPDLSPTATVLEVRAHDARGLLWATCRAIADAGVSIRSAHVTTFGLAARDVYYVVGDDDGPLDDAGAALLVETVLSRLRG